MRNRLNQTWPSCNEGKGPGCATAWVNSDCFSPGFPNTGNNGTIVPPALIKRQTRDVVRSRSGEGRWVKKGQEGRRGVKRRGVGEKIVRGASLIIIFTLALCLLFPPPSSCFHILLYSQTSSSHPFIHTSVLHHPTSHLLDSFHLSFVPLNFCIWDGEGWFACHTTFASPFPCSMGERE